MKKFLALLLALLMLVSLVACGKQEESQTPPEEVTPEVVEDGRTLEDKLVVYTACSEKLWEQYSTPFVEAYPDIEIEVVYGGIGELMARVQGEASNPVADLVFAGLSASDGNMYFDFFQPYNTTYADELTLACPNDYYTPFCNSVACFCINTELEKELGLDIRSYEDLLDPKLEGKIITADPNSSSAAWNNLSNMHSVYGMNSDALWSFVEKLMPNLVVASSSSATYNSVADGEYVVGLSMESGTSNVIIDGADWCELRYPSEGASGIDGCAAVIKNCAHPNCAMEFIDMATSVDGCNRIYEVYPNGRLNNINAKAPNVPEALVPDAEMNWVVRPVAELTAAKDEILTHWNDIYAKTFG